jgi:phosphoserine phosphatase
MMLTQWPAHAARQLEALIQRHAHSGAYAVFDADNTSYQHDLIGAFLPYLEARGVLTRDSMNPALKLTPFKDSAGQRESLHSYYLRLGDIDDQVSYPWASQIFAGLKLRDLKRHLDEMLASGAPIATTCFENGVLRPMTVNPPRMLPGQQQLYRALQAHGIEVWVVSAASEELVRMVLADPRYGYHVKPSNVIGVSLLLRSPDGEQVTTARKLIAEGRYRPEDLLDHELTPTLWAPAPWYEGKQAAIHTYIHGWKRPILVAGDTPASDGPMLFRGPDVERGALRLFVLRKQAYHEDLRRMQAEHMAHQVEHRHPANAEANWVVVRPEQLG